MKTGSGFISKDLKKKQSFELKLRRLCSGAGWLNTNVCRSRKKERKKIAVSWWESSLCSYCHLTRGGHRHGGKFFLSDDLTKMMEVILEQSFKVKHSLSYKKKMMG